MIIRPSEVHDNPERARLGVGLAAEALGIPCDCRLASAWFVKINSNECDAFLERARECAQKGAS